jgi:3-hydroxybutyryl-CoA dehydrogenase
MQIKNVAVLGAGTMGLGITQVVADAGFNVALWSRRGEKGLDRLREKLQKAISKKILTQQQVDYMLSNVHCILSLSEAVNEVELVIEAVREDLFVKGALFKELDSFCSQSAILASNTSALCIYKISEFTSKPDKVIGMHFFNPAPIMKLVEVVPSSLTSQDAIDSIIDFSQKIGKVPLIVRDTPGFVVNRCLMPMINEAAFLFMNKTATAETIDSAIKLGANHPLGPLALADLIGIDICLETMQEIKNDLGNSNYQICPLLESMVTEGNLGRKTGKGFFTYKTNSGIKMTTCVSSI